MGYYVEVLESTFTIPVENLDECYDRMCALNYTVKNSDKRGGSWGSEMSKDDAPEYGPHECAWFSWMSWDYDKQCENAQDILESLGFDVELDDDNLCIVGYDSKSGQEDLFLESISDLVKGYIVWKGEDGEIWGETYGGEKPIVKKRVFPANYSDIVN